MALKLKERTYRRVPKNSILEIRVTPKSGTDYTLNGRLDHGTTKKKSWTHAQLKNKTVRYTLKDSGTNNARISIAFSGTANSTVEVEAKIIKPDKSQHSTTWTTSLFGKKGDVGRAKVRVRVS